MDPILQDVNAIFSQVLDDPDLVITSESKADDVEGWDSLTHINLVVAIEKKFGIRFTSKEIQSWSNVGEMMVSIQEKGN